MAGDDQRWIVELSTHTVLKSGEDQNSVLGPSTHGLIRWHSVDEIHVFCV